MDRSRLLEEDLDLPICCTCGNAYGFSPPPLPTCRICEDDRQWLPSDGPHWTSLRALSANGGHCTVVRPVEAAVYSIETQPKVGIGQRCLLLQQPGEESVQVSRVRGGKRGDRDDLGRGGNVLWDCCAFLDKATVQAVTELGGVQKIVLSHPHFLGSCVTWSKVFGDAPIYMHASDKHWVTRKDESRNPPSSRYSFWEGEELQLSPSLKVVRLGGHFPSSSVLLWASAPQDDKAVLFTGDTILPVPHGRWCSFMYSFPNLLPLPDFVVESILKKVTALPAFDRLYGPFSSSSIQGNAKDAVLESAQRYLDSLAGKYHGK